MYDMRPMMRQRREVWDEMKKTYDKAELEILCFGVEDVVVTSGNGMGEGEEEN